MGTWDSAERLNYKEIWLLWLIGNLREILTMENVSMRCVSPTTSEPHNWRSLVESSLFGKLCEGGSFARLRSQSTEFHLLLAAVSGLWNENIYDCHKHVLQMQWNDGEVPKSVGYLTNVSWEKKMHWNVARMDQGWGMWAEQNSVLS